MAAVPPFRSGNPNHNDVLEFLRVRKDRYNDPILDYFEEPVYHPGGWIELRNKAFDETKLPMRSAGPYADYKHNRRGLKEFMV